MWINFLKQQYKDNYCKTSIIDATKFHNNNKKQKKN